MRWLLNNYLLLVLVAIVVGFGIFQYVKTDKQVHYIGETQITSEQYTGIIANGNLDNRYNNLTKNDDGTLVFKYDFLSIYQYDFLNIKHPSSFLDAPYFYNVIRGFRWYNVVTIVIYIILVWLALAKRRWVMGVAQKVTHYFERRADRKVPIVSSATVYTDPNQLNTEAYKGLLCVRSWNFDSSEYELKSIVQGTRWKSNQLVAKSLPKKGDMGGIYGYRLGVSVHQTGTVMGVVELDGKYEYHTDIIRAEHCKVLGFFMSKGYQRLARFLSNKYVIPVYMSEDAETAYLEWLFSQSGQKSLQHNFEIMGGK